MPAAVGVCGSRRGRGPPASRPAPYKLRPHVPLRFGVRVVGPVMATRESSWRCALCAGGLVVRGPAHLVTGSTKKGRRRVYGTFLICAPCYTTGAPDPVTGLIRPAADRRAADRRAGATERLDLAGRGPILPPGPCLACGLAVVRRAEKLLKEVTCSHACRTSLTRIRHGGRGSGRPCGACGQPVMSGRADSAYCRPACRQKAYRRRAAGPRPSPGAPDRDRAFGDRAPGPARRRRR